MCTSARFITRSQRRYETQTRDYSRTPSSTTEYGLFRVSSDLRLGELPLPVAGISISLAPAMVAEGVACIRRSARSLARGVKGEAHPPGAAEDGRRRPASWESPHRGHVLSFHLAGTPDCKQGQAASSPTLQGPGSGHPESGGI